MNETSVKAIRPTLSVALGIVILVLGVIIAGLRMGVRPQMCIFAALMVAIVASLVLKNPWKDIEREMTKSISRSITAVLILMLVGALIGVWGIGGTIPTMINYGLKVVSPSMIVPITFLLCALTSVLTGTSFGSIATMGVVLLNLGLSMGVPAPLLAGALVSGAVFGDKMSPMSDTTNLAATMAGTDLYSHIQSMLYTTVPASFVVLIIYTVMGLNYGTSGADASNISLVSQTIVENYHISIWTVLPIVVLLTLSVMRVPAVLAMGISVIVSFVEAVLVQGSTIVATANAALNGYVSATGIDLIDKILSRGGISSMFSTIILVFFASALGGVLIQANVIDVLMKDGLLKRIKSRRSLIFANMIYCYSIVLLTGNQSLGIVLPGQTLKDSYDEFDLNRRVLSRTLEDTSTIAVALIPWGGFAIYVTSTLGVGMGYIPYAMLSYVVPVFSILCAVTGIGVWNTNNEKVRRNIKLTEAK